MKQKTKYTECVYFVINFFGKCSYYNVSLSRLSSGTDMLTFFHNYREVHFGFQFSADSVLPAPKSVNKSQISRIEPLCPSFRQCCVFMEIN